MPKNKESAGILIFDGIELTHKEFMNFLSKKYFANIKPAEFIIVTIVFAVLSSLMNYIISNGCLYSLNGNQVCSIFHSSLQISGAPSMVYELSFIQILLLGLIFFILYVCLKKKINKKSNIWSSLECFIIIPLSIILFTYIFGSMPGIIDQVTKKKFLELDKWVVNCKNNIIETPFFKYDPNENRLESQKEWILICTSREQMNKNVKIFNRY